MIQQAGLFQSVLDAVDQATPELLDLARFIHAHPDLAMQDHQAASLMTGCRLQLGESETPYDDAVPNLTLARAIQAEFDAVGLAGPPPYAGPGIASSDVGNVSYVAPNCHSIFSISDEDIPWHSQACASASDTDAAYAAMLKAAKASALTALDLLLDASLVRAVRQEFESALAARESA